MNTHWQRPSAGTLTLWLIGLVVGAVSLIVVSTLGFWLFIAIYYRPAEYRFPFSTGAEITEEVAVELSRKALILNGKAKETMRPVAGWGYKDASGHQVLFARNTIDPQEGTVLWWLNRSECLWEYSVRIRREGGEIVCSIYKPL